MQVQVGSTRPDNLPTDILAVGFFGKGGRRSAAWKALSKAIGGGLDSLLKIQGWTGKAGEQRTFLAPTGLRARLVMVTSLGERGTPNTELIRAFAASVGAAARKGGLTRVAFYLDPALDPRGDLTPMDVEAVGAGLEWGAYAFDRHLAKQQGGGAPTNVYLYFEGRKLRDELAAGVERGAIIGRAQNIGRDLVNEPANIIDPEALVEFARELAADRGLEIQVFDKAACAKRGMGAFLAVARGSVKQPALVHMVHRPKGKAKRRVALVGKALTFDAGGLCLKPAAAQATMKLDMGGSAAVLGAIAAAADLQLDVELHAIFATCENMLGADAFRTGDVLTAANGKTIEVLNTDAEGRLTLADALHYACTEVKPDQLVDLATLTGACMVALGPNIAGIMGSSRSLVRDLRAAGDRSGEPLWELPMPDAYREMLQSKIADLKNLGSRYGGAITAGMFLREFVDEKIPWAHIDIAGPSFVDTPLSGQSYGGTGFPIRALVDWLSQE